MAERVCQLNASQERSRLEQAIIERGTDRKLKFMQISRVATFIMHKNTKSQISIDFKKAIPGLILAEKHK